MLTFCLPKEMTDISRKIAMLFLFLLRMLRKHVVFDMEYMESRVIVQRNKDLDKNFHIQCLQGSER